MHVTPAGVGRDIVRFPQIGTKGGVVLVTAVSVAPAWCQAQQWHSAGVTEIATVACYVAGGKAAFEPFVVMFASSTAAALPTGSAYGYLHFLPGHGLLASFNSSGHVNTVTPLGTGKWRVVLHGLGSAKPAGNVQLTAADPTATAKCEIANWTPAAAKQTFIVRCYGAGSVPLASGWALVYQRVWSVTGWRPDKLGYTFNDHPVSPTYKPTPAGISFNALAGYHANTVSPAGTGLRLVTFPRIGALPSMVAVTGYDIGPGFCDLLATWAIGGGSVIVRDVACYTPAGKLVNRRSLVSYTAAH